MSRPALAQRTPLVAALAGFGLAAAVFGLSSMQVSAGPLLPVYPPQHSWLTQEQAQVLSLLSVVYLSDGQGGACRTLRVTGANLQVVNGLGATQTTNCLGNVIVGYAETGNTFGDLRTGSHNLVVGDRHSYTSFGGLVAAQNNTSGAPYGCVSGGTMNRALGNHSAVAGGTNNLAQADISNVNGGRSNTTTGGSCVVNGGQSNVAGGAFCTINGGWGNQTDFWLYATVNGGSGNLANANRATVCGGQGNTASHDSATVSGGCGNATTTSCEHLP